LQGACIIGATAAAVPDISLAAVGEESLWLVSAQIVASVADVDGFCAGGAACESCSRMGSETCWPLALLHSWQLVVDFDILLFASAIAGLGRFL
jgi:hypothetical protein